MKKKTNYAIHSTILGIMLLSTVSANEFSFHAFAQTNSDDGFTIRNVEQINKDPLAKSILEKIELMKKRIAEINEKKRKEPEHQKFIDQQIDLVKQELEKDLSRMHDKYRDYTPKASFMSFVSSKTVETQNVYWDMFNFQQQKVVDARQAMKDVLDKGGSLQEARDAYDKAAAMKRVQLIDITKDLNIKHGLADKKIQSTLTSMENCQGMIN